MFLLTYTFHFLSPLHYISDFYLIDLEYASLDNSSLPPTHTSYYPPEIKNKEVEAWTFSSDIWQVIPLPSSLPPPPFKH